MAGTSASSSFGDLPVVAKLGIFVLVIAAVSAIYFFVFHMPLQAEIAGAQSEKTRLEGARTEAQQRRQDFVALNEELAGRQAMDRENQRVLPADPEIAAFLQDLNRLGELSGLDFKLIEPRPEEQVGAASEESTAAAPANEESTSSALYVRIPVSLNVKGRYHQILKFFYNVSRLDRAISMEDVQLSNPEIVGDEVVLDVRVMATTFRRLAAADAPEAAQ